MYKVNKKTLDFLDKAPIQIHKTFVTSQSAENFWNMLVESENWSDWFPNITKAYTISEKKNGVGSQRIVHMGNFISKEQFIVWNPHHEWSFTVVSLNLPILKGMVEQVLIDEIDPLKIKVTWRVSCELKWWAKPLQNFFKKDLNNTFNKLIKTL